MAVTHSARAGETLFTITDPELQIVTRTKGVFKQCTLYHRDGGYLYAKDGSGYVRILARGMTTKPHTRWDYIEGSGEIAVSDDFMGAPVWRK